MIFINILKYIHRNKTKNGFSLSVIVPVNGKAKRFGTFKRSDYASDRDVMAAAKECRDKALMDRRQNKVVMHELTVREAYQKSLDLFVTNVKTRERHNNTFQNLIPANIKNKPISKVTAAEIQMMINKYAQNHSADSLNRTKTLWKQIYKAAAMSGCPVYDQSQMIVMPKAKKPQSPHAKHCTVEQLEEFIEALRDYNSFLPEGKKISRDELQPADLIFYADSSGTINHVAIYIGNNQVIHASSPKTGIKISKYNYRTPVKYVRVLED